MNINNRPPFPIYNNLLNQLIGSHQTLPAIPVIKPNVNIITRIWNQFQRFVHWLTGRNAVSNDDAELKMRYAMHLFETYDASLLSFAENRQEEFPLWRTIEAQVKFLDHCQDSIKFPFPKIESLRQAVAVGKELHEARYASAKVRRAKIQEIKAGLLAKLNSNAPFCFPGGVLHYQAIEKAFQALGIKAVESLSSKMIHLLYEVEKIEGGIIRLSIFNADDAVSPVFNIPEDEFESVLQVLLEVQTEPHVLHNASRWERFKYGWNLSLNLLANNDTHFHNGLSNYKFEDLLQRIKPFARHDTDTLTLDAVRSTASKTMAAYKKCMDLPFSVIWDLGEKIDLFLEIFELNQNRLGDPKIKKWLIDSAVSLLNMLREQSKIQTDDLPDFNLRFKQIVDQLGLGNEVLEFSWPGENSPIASASTSFEDAIHFNHEIISLDDYKSATSTELAVVAPLNHIRFDAPVHDILVEMSIWHEQCHIHSHPDKIEILAYLLADIQRNLLEADRLNFWSKREFTHEHILALTHFLHKITLYETQVHFGLRKPGPLPQQILSSLKNLERYQYLLYGDALNNYDSNKLDLSFIKEILKDPWLDLDIDGPEIYATIDRIESSNRRPVNLTDPTVLGSYDTPPMMKLRDMIVWITAKMARYHTLGDPSWATTVRENFSIFTDYFLKNIDDMDQATLEAHFARVDHQLYSRLAPGQIEVRNFYMFKETVQELFPYRLAFFQPNLTHNNNFGSPFNFKKIPSQYRRTAQEVPEPIAKEVIEAAVANDGVRCWDEMGNEIRADQIEAHRHRYMPPGSQNTEGSIIHDSEGQLGIARDIWTDIRLTQTSPQTTRIPNTLALFFKYPHLLTHHRYGLSFQRLFRLNLFRANAISAFIHECPSRVNFIYAQLKAIIDAYNAESNTEGFLFMQHLIRDVSIISGHHQVMPNLEKQLNELQEQCDTSPQLKAHRRAIHQAFLLRHCRSDQNPDPTLFRKLMKSYFYIRFIPEPAQVRNRYYEDQINDFIHRIAPLCDEIYRDHRNVFHALLNEICQTKNLIWKKSEGSFCYRSGNLEVDLKEGQLYRDGIAQAFLPDAITHDPTCYALFGKEEIFTIHTTKEKIYRDKQRGAKFEFHFRDQLYRIYLLPGQKRYIYKHIEGGWYQLDEFNDTRQVQKLPLAIFQNFFWRSLKGSHFIVENALMQCLYKGKLSSDKKSISQLETQAGKRVLNPWLVPDFSRFLALSYFKNLFALGHHNQVTEIVYQDFELSYHYDRQNNIWFSNQFPGYRLSSETIEMTLHKGTERCYPGFFFEKQFKNYHLLVNNQHSAILLLTDFEYKHRVQHAESRNIRMPPEPVQGELPPQLYIFEIDPYIGLKSKTSDGYLYLAYLLFTQGKYDLCLNYINKARGIEPDSSRACQRLISLFKKWPDTSSRALIIRLHLALLVLANTSQNISGKANHTDLTKQLTDLVNLYNQYKTLEEKGLVPHSLKITNIQKREFFEKLILTGKTSESPAPIDFTRSLIAEFTGTFINAQLQSLPPEYQSILEELQESSHTLRQILNDEIAILLKKLAQASPQECTNINTGVISIPLFPKEFTASMVPAPSPEVRRDENPQAKKERKDLTFAQELREDINDDILIANDSAPLKTFPPHFVFSGLLAQAKEGKTTFESIVLDHLVEIESFIQTASETPNNLNSWIDILENRTELQDHLINKIIYASATNDWNDLIASKIILEDEIEELKIKIQQYLISKTILHQYEKLIGAIETYELSKNSVHKDRIAQILLQERFYDPENDPLRFFLLLIENDQKIIATERQVEHFKVFASYKDLFKHEALAGGKTSVLRHLIAAFFANGKDLSVQVTVEQLVDRHHPLFKYTTEEAYGRKCLRIVSDRNSPKDGISLRILYRNLLYASLFGQRTDITRRDAIDILHSHILKIDTIARLCRQPDASSHETEIQQLEDEMRVLADIISHFNVYGIANTDEEDQVTTPQMEHNYAIGEARPLLPEKIEFPLKWFVAMLQNPKYQHIFRNNEQYKLTESEINELIDGLDVNDKSNFVNTFVLRNNVHYIRSSDGFTVKPVIVTELGISPNEAAEFGKESETIIYTLYNYMQTGVLPQQIESLVEQENRAASQEIKKGGAVTFLNTTAARRFYQDFGISLLDVSTDDYPAIANNINSDPIKLARFIEERVFPLVKIYDEKLTGNVYEFINMFKQFSGSSGTANSWRTLSWKTIRILEKNPAYRRQPGVDGKIISTIMRQHVYDTDVLLIEKSNLSALITELERNPGSCFIDAASLFPGLTSKQLALLISEKMPGHVIRYLDSNNEFSYFNKAKNQPVNLAEIVTVLAKGQERGNHIDMHDDSIGYVTINRTTTITEFMQAVMRMRKLGQNQRVRFIVDKQTHSLLRRQSSFSDLLDMLCDNEAPHLAKLHTKCEPQQVLASGKAILRAILLNSQSREELVSHWESFRGYFIIKNDSILRPPKETALSFLNFIQEARKSTLHPEILKVMNETERDLQAYATAPNNFLMDPKYLATGTDNLIYGFQQETQHVREIESTKQLQLEFFAEKKDKEKHSSLPWIPFTLTSTDMIIEDNPNNFFQLSETQKFYDSALWISKNLYNPDADHKVKPWGQNKLHKPFPTGQMKFTRIAIAVVDQKISVFICSNKDFDQFFYPVDLLPHKCPFYIYHLETDHLEGKTQDWNQLDLRTLNRIHGYIAQAKHLSGICHLSLPQKKAFELWMKSNKNLSLIETNLKRFIQAIRPSEYPNYQESDLGRLYQRLKK